MDTVGKDRGLIEGLFNTFYTLAEQKGIFSIHDIYLQVNPEHGELTIANEDGSLKVSENIFSWIPTEGESSLALMDKATESITASVRILYEKGFFDQIIFHTPLSVILEQPHNNTQQELLLIDDDWVNLDAPIMEDVDKELDLFFEELMRDCDK